MFVYACLCRKKRAMLRYTLSSERWRVKSLSLMEDWEEKGNRSAAESWLETGEERT